MSHANLGTILVGNAKHNGAHGANQRDAIGGWTRGRHGHRALVRAARAGRLAHHREPALLRLPPLERRLNARAGPARDGPLHCALGRSLVRRGRPPVPAAALITFLT